MLFAKDGKRKELKVISHFIEMKKPVRILPSGDKKKKGILPLKVYHIGPKLGTKQQQES